MEDELKSIDGVVLSTGYVNHLVSYLNIPVLKTEIRIDIGKGITQIARMNGYIPPFEKNQPVKLFYSIHETEEGKIETLSRIELSGGKPKFYLEVEQKIESE